MIRSVIALALAAAVVLAGGCQPADTTLKPGETSKLAGTWTGQVTIFEVKSPQLRATEREASDFTLRILSDGSFDQSRNYELYMLTGGRPVPLRHRGDRAVSQYAGLGPRPSIEVISAFYTATRSQLVLRTHFVGGSTTSLASIGPDGHLRQETVETHMERFDQITCYSADLNEDDSLNLLMVAAGPAEYGGSVAAGILHRVADTAAATRPADE